MDEKFLIPKPPFRSFLVKKQAQEIYFINLDNYETRNESVMRLITLADRQYNFPEFEWILINTDDMDRCKKYKGLKVLCFSTVTDDFSHACPDFVFDNWKQVQVEDYEDTCNKIAEIGDIPPETHMLGWRGARVHPNRSRLVALDNKIDIDAEFIEWNRSNPERLTCYNYVSLPEHPKKWRYLIDVEGAGYSGRLKFFFFSKRVVFLVDRPYKEWFFPMLKPFEHYVPVKRDMSDLAENLKMIKSNPDLEDAIRYNAFDFAQAHLTRDAALARWHELLG